MDENIIIYKKRVIGFVVTETKDVGYTVTALDTALFNGNDQYEPDFDSEKETVKGTIPVNFDMFAVYCTLTDVFGDDVFLGYEVEGEETPDWNIVLKKMIELNKYSN